MLAYDFFRFLSDFFEIILLPKAACDVTDFSQILENIAYHSPDFLVNMAAYTKVDEAEGAGKKENFLVNAMGAFLVAKAAAAFGIECVHISTDYVFDGENPDGYFSDNEPNPINSYGMAKFLGEKMAIEGNPAIKIVRTGSIYGGRKFQKNHKYPDVNAKIFPNFVNTILFLAEQKSSISVIDDQFCCPTNARDLVFFLKKIIDNPENFPETFYHFVSPLFSHGVSRADFAEYICKKCKKKCEIIRIPSEEFLLPALRPKWSILRMKSGQK